MEQIKQSSHQYSHHDIEKKMLLLEQFENPYKYGLV
jgi:hypothetical protein